MTYGNARLPMLLGAMLVSALANAAAIEDRFKSYDANGDGAIDLSEHAVVTASGFKEIDGNHDGRITAEELADSMVKAATQGSPVTTAGLAGARIAAGNVISGIWDRDGNGTVSPAEYKANADASFARSDADHDNRMSLAEMKTGASPASLPRR